MVTEPWLRDDRALRLCADGQIRGSIPRGRDDLLAIGEKGFGDYIIMQIDGTGQIKDWAPPEIDWAEWELCS